MRGASRTKSLFNAANGTYRGPNTQQGYSPFSTWTRGLAWAMLGFAEQLEFIETLDEAPIAGEPRDAVDAWMLDAARATCDFYIDHAACADGIPYWDTGAPGLSPCPAGASVTPIRSTTTSRWTVPPRRSPRRGCCGSATCSIAGS